MRERILLVLVLIAVAVPAGAVTRTVTTLTDESNGCAGGAGCSLREALAESGAGDTVDFAVTGTIQLTLGPLVFASDVTVQGPGSAALAVSGNLVNRVFTVAAGRAVEIRALTLRDGRAPSDGDPHGGCVKNSGTLQLVDAVVDGCRARTLPPETPAAGGDGGGIYNGSGATLVLTRSVVRLCRAGDGGGDPITPPAGGRGGGLFNAGSATAVESSVEQNRAGMGGGPTGKGGDGGGIYSTGSLRLERSTVSANASGDGYQFCAPTCVNGLDGKGGGVWASGSTTLNNTTVSGNALGSTAAGLATTGGGLLLAPVAGQVMRLRNVTVSANTASGAGGGLVREGSGTVRLRHVILAGNAAGTNDKDCSGGSALLVSEGRNLVRVNNGCTTVFGAQDLFGTAAAPLDPGLAPLAAKGGPTLTHALLAASPALDAGSAAGCFGWDPVTLTDVELTVDQRGEPRPRDGDGDLDPVCDPGSFEAPDAPVVTHALTVAPLGSGSGRVTSVPPGIDCPGDCQQVFLEGTGVDLAAVADAGSTFVGWSGDCLGTAACHVQMSADRAVGATFGRLFRLDVARSGAGSGGVTSAPPGIDCGSDCGEDFAEGTLVTLTASPTPGSVFVGWSGDCGGRVACELEMGAPRTATARFEPGELFADGFETGGLENWVSGSGE